MQHHRITTITVLSAVITVLSAVIISTLNAPAQTRVAQTPPALLGAWMHTEWQANFGHYNPDRDQNDSSNRDPVGWRDGYKFFEDGSYQHSHFASLDIPGCDVKTLRQEAGFVHFERSFAQFENRMAKLSAQDRCHRQNNFEGRPDKLAQPRNFEWRLAKNRNGQEVLLLKGVDGREILYHREPSGNI
jgi:hypothetical protein